MNKTILLVEDDTDLLMNNREYLARRGYRTLTAETLKDAVSLLAREQPDLILLDVNMPDGSGFDFIERVRETNDVPMIFLTCRTDKADMIDGLTRGGCDYITKPFDLDVLLARIEAQLRKAGMQEVIKRGPLTLNIVPGQAVLAGADMTLAKKEFAILLLLVQNEGRTLTKEYLYEKAWGQPLLYDDNALYVQMSRLKRKLEQNEAIELYVSRKEGYCLNILE